MWKKYVASLFHSSLFEKKQKTLLVWMKSLNGINNLTDCGNNQQVHTVEVNESRLAAF